MAASTAALLTEFGHSLVTTLPMLFSDDCLHKLKQVRGMVKTAGTVRAYQILPGIRLHIDYDGALVPAIEECCFNLHHERAAPLLHYIERVKAIHLQFEEVKAVLRWMNRNATPGAIRHYWPTAMHLCPHSGLPTDMPSRHKTPEGISNWMQAIRDSANTMVSALMLPGTAAPQSRDKHMWLQFQPQTVKVGLPTEYGTTIEYQTDHMIYNI